MIMSCLRPKIIENKKYLGKEKYYTIPCGTCINCRLKKTIEKQNELEYVWKKYKYGTFLTLTYDDEYLENNNKIKMSNGEYNYTLKLKDYQLFLKRLRENIKRNKLTTGIEEKWCYTSTGEYGDKYNRPHIHMLLFGLDFLTMKKVYQECWQFGIIKSLPIKNGAIRYILKYQTKSINDKNFYKLYDENNLERPFFKHSKNIATEFYYKQLPNILNNGHIKIENKEYSTPRYYLNKALTQSMSNNQLIHKLMEQQGIPKILVRGIPTYSKQQREDFIKFTDKAKIKNYIEQQRAKGKPIEDYEKEINYLTNKKTEYIL